MSPLERLLAETIPDGTFGGTRTPTPARSNRPQPTPRPWTPTEQAAHVADLQAELDRHEDRGTSHHPAPARRLRAVPNAAA